MYKDDAMRGAAGRTSGAGYMYARTNTRRTMDPSERWALHVPRYYVVLVDLSGQM